MIFASGTAPLSQLGRGGGNLQEVGLHARRHQTSGWNLGGSTSATRGAWRAWRAVGGNSTPKIGRLVPDYHYQTGRSSSICKWDFPLPSSCWVPPFDGNSHETTYPTGPGFHHSKTWRENAWGSGFSMPRNAIIMSSCHHVIMSPSCLGFNDLLPGRSQD